MWPRQRLGRTDQTYRARSIVVQPKYRAMEAEVKSIKQLVSKELWAHLKRAAGPKMPRNVIWAYLCARHAVAGTLFRDREDFEMGPQEEAKPLRDRLCNRLLMAAESLEQAADEIEKGYLGCAHDTLAASEGFILAAKRIAYDIHLYW